MIKYYYKAPKAQKVTEASDTKPGTWIHAEAPTDSEIELLTSRFKLEAGHLQDALDEDEVPRLEREKDQIYLFVRYAFPNREGEMDTAPLLIIFGSKILITITPSPLPAVGWLLKGKIDFATTQPSKLILLILSHISEQYDTSISRTSRKITRIRSQLRTKGIANKDFIDFATIENELSEFLSSLQPTNAVLRRLLVSRQWPQFEADQDIVEDLLLNNEQSIEASRSNLRSISSIREAYSAINANNLNRILTILTVVTVVMSVPGIIMGLYGLNVPLPFQHTFWIFWVFVVVNLFLMIGVVYAARKKHII